MYQNLKNRYYRWLAIKRLIHRYDYLNQVNIILEEYLTSKLLRGGSTEFMDTGRKQLVEKQNEIKETGNMVDFLKQLK
jgi:hypothetical protein